MDSLHLLIMDAHRALNRLQAAIGTETIDDAAVYQVDEADRPLVRAFMEGLHSTIRLKLDHPGLATTATRSGKRLLIQNDIGETLAHVVVMTVEDLTVTITYTDVHPERLRFFKSLLDTERQLIGARRAATPSPARARVATQWWWVGPASRVAKRLLHSCATRARGSSS